LKKGNEVMRVNLIAVVWQLVVVTTRIIAYYDVILFGVEFYGIADGRGAVPSKN